MLKRLNLRKNERLLKNKFDGMRFVDFAIYKSSRLLVLFRVRTRFISEFYRITGRLCVLVFTKIKEKNYDLFKNKIRHLLIYSIDFD